MLSIFHRNTFGSFVSLVGLVFLLRLVTLHMLPFVDPSEGRYALISQIMNRTGDYITPRLIARDGTAVAFLGKPPLLYWCAALWSAVIGFGELATRLPSFFAAALTLLFTGLFAHRCFPSAPALKKNLLEHDNGNIAQKAVLILASSSIFLAFAGVCQIDMLLTAANALALLSFYLMFLDRDAKWRSWGWGLLFFLGLGIGMLAKGPVAIVLVGASVGLWFLWSGQWSVLLRIPWIAGILVFFFVAAPWYYFAELKSPGFLHYFFVNENFLRYVSTEYGDRYGSSHQVPHGISWLYLLLGMFPWCLYLLQKRLWIRRSILQRLVRRLSDADKFVICWLVGPALFFTLSRSVLISYLVPALPGLAIFLAKFLSSRNVRRIVGETSRRRTTLVLSAVMVLAAIAAFIQGFQYSVAQNIPPADDSLTFGVVLLGAAGYLLARLISQPTPQYVQHVALLSVLAFCSATCTLRRYVNDHFSARGLLRAIELKKIPEDTVLNFAQGIPYSANIYTTRPLKSETDPLSHPITASNELLILRTSSRASKLIESVQTQDMNLVIEAGGWKAFQINGKTSESR